MDVDNNTALEIQSEVNDLYESGEWDCKPLLDKWSACGYDAEQVQTTIEAMQEFLEDEERAQRRRVE